MKQLLTSKEANLKGRVEYLEGLCQRLWPEVKHLVNKGSLMENSKPLIDLKFQVEEVIGKTD